MHPGHRLVYIMHGVLLWWLVKSIGSSASPQQDRYAVLLSSPLLFGPDLLQQGKRTAHVQFTGYRKKKASSQNG
eukprot:1156609-Pelagomonas_calceolata.AAC.4